MSRLSVNNVLFVFIVLFPLLFSSGVARRVPAQRPYLKLRLVLLLSERTKSGIETARGKTKKERFALRPCAAGNASVWRREQPPEGLAGSGCTGEH